MTGPRGAGATRHPVLAFLAGSVALGLVVAGMALPVLGAGAIAARNASRNFENLPSVLDAPPPPARSVLLASDGTVIGVIASENRVQIPLDLVNIRMQQAIVAIEDARFYQHGGIDLRGAARALARNSSAGTVEQGGSTLTQQYVKNVLIEDARNAKEREAASARTLTRKLQEARYAIGLEQHLTKNQILERYLNIAYFGDGAYGVEAAATHYFGVHAKKLDLVQAATLAGIVQSPQAYDPATNPRLSQQRRDTVLDRMQQEHLATPAQVAAAKATPLASYLRVQPARTGCITSLAPYFCDYVLSVMRTDPAFGATAADRAALLKRGGLTIHTTLDPSLQRKAQKVVDAYIPRRDPSGKATAVDTIEPGTGAIRVMAQNRTYGTKHGATTINYSVGAAHNGWTEGVQAGSTFKAFTVAAALAKGLPVQTYFDTRPLQTFTGYTDCQGYRLAPFTTRSDASGTQSMDSATALSVNGYFAALEQKVGVCSTARMADRLGVRTGKGNKVPRVPSLTLGTATTTPLDMAAAYATFAADGLHCTPLAITAVNDRDGHAVAVPPTSCKQVITPAVAEATTQVLTNVIDGHFAGRTGAAMTLGRPAAGKTGTTENNAAVWFVGYTPQLATAVWVGDPRGGSLWPLRNITINGHYYSQLYGATIAGPIWRQVMLDALDGVDVVPFTEPDPAGGVAGIPTTVPDLRDADSTDALQRLQEAGLNGRISPNLVDSALPAGTVIYTSPSAGAHLLSGDTVTLYVSSGSLPAAPPSPTTSPGTPTGTVSPASPVTSSP